VRKKRREHRAKHCETPCERKPRETSCEKNAVNTVQNTVKRRVKENTVQKNIVRKNKKGLPPIQKAAHRGRVCLNSNSKNNILKMIYVIFTAKVIQISIQTTFCKNIFFNQ
jgi:hypothetical protein